MITTLGIADRYDLTPQVVRARAKSLGLRPKVEYGVQLWNSDQEFRLSQKPKRGRPPAKARKGKA